MASCAVRGSVGAVAASATASCRPRLRARAGARRARLSGFRVARPACGDAARPAAASARSISTADSSVSRVGAHLARERRIRRPIGHVWPVPAFEEPHRHAESGCAPSSLRTVATSRRDGLAWLAEQLQGLVERHRNTCLVARRASGTRPHASRTGRSARSWRRPPSRTPGRLRPSVAATGAGGLIAGRSLQGRRRRSATRASASPRLPPRGSARAAHTGPYRPS